MQIISVEFVTFRFSFAFAGFTKSTVLFIGLVFQALGNAIYSTPVFVPQLQSSVSWTDN